MPEPTNVTTIVKPLLDRLDVEASPITRYRSYYDGNHPSLNYSTARFREAFGQQLAGLASNFMSIIVDTISGRLNVLGFRFGPENDPDTLVWDAIWQANNMDSGSVMAMTDALVTGRCPVMVWPNESGVPRITVEDARNTIVRYRPGDRVNRLDALKRWTDRDGYGRLTYFTADEVRLYRTEQRIIADEIDIANPTTNDTYLTGSNAQWNTVDVLPNPFGAVPVVELRPRPKVDGTCSSELLSLTPLQDSVNYLLSSMLVAAEYQAFQQRWVTGIDVPRDDNGQPLQPFPETARLFVSESPDTKFGEFGQVDLGVFTGAISNIVEQMASQSGVPGHILLRLEGQFPSGESINAAESSLVDKAKRYSVNMSDAWEEVVRLALVLLGDPRAVDTSCEVIYADPANHNIAALTDSLLKLQQLGVPNEALWAMLPGVTPQTIESWRAKGPSTPPVTAQAQA